MSSNPFVIHGVVGRPAFTDRADEVRRVRQTLEEPGAKLLVYGERRMGKTSALRVAAEDHAREGGIVCIADFSTASSPIDLANRVLSSATEALGSTWRDFFMYLANKVGLRLTVGLDPRTQAPTASLDLSLRSAPVAQQRDSLVQVLDMLNELSRERGSSLGVILDEFQEVHRFGGEEAEWHLRGAMQHHGHLSYVVAGSRTHLIQAMLGEGRAFYKLFDVLRFGPIEAEHLALWIEDRFAESGVRLGDRDLGALMVALAEPRTRDVVQLARKTWAMAQSAGGVDRSIVERALREIIADEDDPLRAHWESQTPRQQNVLRAVAAQGGPEDGPGLTASDTLTRFALKSSSATTQIASKFVETGVLERTDRGQYRFDSPFYRGWVVTHALPDMGIYLPVTWPVGGA